MVCWDLMRKQLDMVSAESWSSEPRPLLRSGLLKYNLCTIKFTFSTGFHKYISLCNPHHHQYVERYYRHPHISLSSPPQPLVTTDPSLSTRTCLLQNVIRGESTGYGLWSLAASLRGMPLRFTRRFATVLCAQSPFFLAAKD